MATKAKKETTYDSSSIETQRFPHNVRNNPGMYLGGVDAYGLWTSTKELLDNGADEFMAGRNDLIHLFGDKDGSYWVWDNGHGIPQGIKKTTININGEEIVQKMPTMQAVFGELHTSGKYRSEAYAVSIGTHGVGAKGTNATSEYFDVVTCYEGEWFKIGFKKGELTTPVAKTKAPTLPTGQKLERGTVIHFKPDAKIFSVKTFPASMAVEWAEIMAYMNPGLKIVVQNAKTTHEFFSKVGPREYIEKRLAKFSAEAEKIMFVHNDDLCDIVVAFASYDGSELVGMTNSVKNRDGGKHVDATINALYQGIKSHTKPKKVDGKLVYPFRAQDFRDGLIGLVNAKLHKAQFSSQDKARLVDDRLGTAFEEALVRATSAFFKDNKALAGRLIDRATRISELRQSFTLSKKAAADLNRVKRQGLPAKYAGYDKKTKVEDRELFLVEGDSAAGELKKARRPWQAVLPLKGKILNALKDTKSKAMESEEIINILAAIGYDPKAADPLAKLTVGKIVCLADPDPDGPFVGDTMIRSRFLDDGDLGHQEQEVRISHLARQTEAGMKFEVPVWSGKRVIWAPATAALVANVDTLVALEIGKHKYKVSEGHKFLIIKTKATRDREHSTYDPNPCLAWIEAKDMHVGDRMYYPTYDLLERHDWDKQDKSTGLGFLAVNKLRRQKLSEPVPVYCLTVPRHHNFILPSGLVSANCHINSLLLTLFYKYLPELFERGMVYVAAVPEFFSLYKGKLVQGDTLSEVQSQFEAAKIPATTPVTHIKGYGEIGANLIRHMICDASTRRMIKIQALSDGDHTDFTRLMNDDVNYRREMLGLPDNSVADAADTAAEKKPVAKKAPAKKTVARKASA